MHVDLGVSEAVDHSVGVAVMCVTWGLVRVSTAFEKERARKLYFDRARVYC